MSMKVRSVHFLAVWIPAVAVCVFFGTMIKAEAECGISTAASCEYITVQEPVADGEVVRESGTDGNQAGQPAMKEVKYRIDYIDGVEVQRTVVENEQRVAGAQSWPTEIAIDMVSKQLDQLRDKYPDSYYWNHEITEENKGKTVNGTWIETWEDVVTTHPCNHDFDRVGQYGCNAFDHGIACWGFANKVFYEVFGIRAYDTERLYDVENISVGDHVRFNYTHSAIVVARDGDKITLLECNYNCKNCQIQWDRVDSIKNVVWYQHAENWDEVDRGQKDCE